MLALKGAIKAEIEEGERIKLLLFVSSHCPHCPGAERVARKVAPAYYEHGLSYSKIRTKTSEGKDLSSRYNIMGTPAMLLLDDDWKELKRIVGVPSEDSLKNDIENALGMRKSLFSRLLGGK